MYRNSAAWLSIAGLLGAAGVAEAVATFSLNKTTFQYNETVTATWTRDAAEILYAKDWFGIYKSGQIPGGSGIYSTYWRYTNNSQTAPAASVQSGSFGWNASALGAGSYVTHFLRNDGYVAIATPVAFTVLATPTFTLNKSSFAPGESITVTWSRPSGSTIYPKDWVGFYSSTGTPGSGNPSLAWNYLNNSRTAPADGILSGSFTMAMPTLATGTYKAYVLGNDTYGQVVPPATFTIVATGGPAVPQFVGSPFRLRHATTGSAYSGRIRGYAKDADAGDTLTFAKTSGPAWLGIAADGTLSGTPTASDAGTNTFTVSATDLAGNSSTGTFTVQAFAPGTGHVDQLRALTYNLFHGWGKVNNGFRKGLDSIILADVDVICMQECTDNVTGGNAFQPQLAAAELGWYYAKLPSSGDIGVLSRYPISQTFTSLSTAVGARVRLCESPMQEVIVYSTHLDYTYYGPYKAAEAGSTNESTLAEELSSQRDEQSAALMMALQSQLAAADDTPVIFAGDFNCPSHLDWTPAAAFLHSGKTLAWPATVNCVNAGLKDSYRELHPDPVADPGNTWAPIYNGDEPMDRIDMIFYKGRNLKVASSVVYHTAVEVRIPNYSGNHALIANNTWPTDHAAVLTVFSLKPIDLSANGMPDYWENEQFGGTATDGPLGDPDGDGICNLIECALGTLPTQSDARTLTGSQPGNDGMHFNYLRPKNGVHSGDGYHAGGYRFRIQRSANLGSWLPADDCLSSNPLITSETASLERADYQILPPSGTTSLYFRLAVDAE